MVPKADKTFRFVTDFRRVNSITKTDTYPLPRIDDCIDQIGRAVFVSKVDLLKGYWQVPLTERAKQISAFTTPDGLFVYNVLPFGLKNAPPTFQRLMNFIVADLKGTAVYIDDVIIYSQSWKDHIDQLVAFFEKLVLFNLTINLSKSEFGQARVTFLGHTVGQGKVSPIESKVASICKFPVPENKKALMRFLGMAGFYRKFCCNFSVIASPLTDLLKKNVPFLWSPECEEAFQHIKGLLVSKPVLAAPSFDLPFKLAVDASDVGIGAVLLQEDKQGIDHPVSYFSKKFNHNQRKYSTIEKEALAMLSALQHYEVYVGGSSHTTIVFTDHNPLTFLTKMRNHSQRLLRWYLIMQEYNVRVVHLPGKYNVIADTLSRSPVSEN